MSYQVRLILLFFFYSVLANIEGPFLFTGPRTLEKYRRQDQKYLDQDELIRIYGEQAAIVVFNNQDSVPLSRWYFPQLWKILEGQTTLALWQDFLDVHPDYINNKTKVLTLQGPWSDRDAQMAETFTRLQDIYGVGNVLGILGYSVSQRQAVEYLDGETWAKIRRQAPTDETLSSVTPEDTPMIYTYMFSLYNATGPPGQRALLVSLGFPELRRKNISKIVFNTMVGIPTIKASKLDTIMVVQFLVGENKEPATLEFGFKQSAGWWTAVGVEVKFGLETVGLSLSAPRPPYAPSATLGRAYFCSLPLVYWSKNATLTLPNVMMQMFMNSTDDFDDAFECVPNTTLPIWSSLIMSSLMLIYLSISISMSPTKTKDHFETNRRKHLKFRSNSI